MVVGIDVYNDVEDKNKSISAFVASRNGTNVNGLNCTKWYSRCVVQQSGQRFADSLTILMLGMIYIFIHA